jgi:choline dehydrogenase-like flavoprotein
MNETVDMLIIGAGASGAAVAWSLADTRMKILCLEHGLPDQWSGLGSAAVQ